MRRKWNGILCFLLVTAGVLGWYGWQHEKELPVVQGQFFEYGVNLQWNEYRDLIGFAVEDGRGRVIAKGDVGPGERKEISIFFSWAQNESYRILVKDVNGGVLTATLAAPEKAAEQTQCKLSFLYDADGGKNEDEAVLPVGTVNTLTLRTKTSGEELLRGKIQLLIPKGIEPVHVPEGWEREQTEFGWIVSGPVKLESRLEKKSFQCKLRADDRGVRDAIRAIVNWDNGRQQWREETAVGVLTEDGAALGKRLKISGIEAPVDGQGKEGRAYKSGVLVYTPPTVWASFLGGKNEMIRLDDEPYSFAKIRLTNTEEEGLLTFVNMRVEEGNISELAGTFRVPAHKNAGRGYSYSICRVPGKGECEVIFPLYLDESKVMNGQYTIRAEAGVLGTKETVTTGTMPLEVIVRQDRPLLLTLGMTMAGLMVFGVVCLRKNSLLQGFSTKELVIVALFGTVAFVAVNLPQTVLWDLGHVLLGPFSFLVTGLFGQTILYALFAALLVVVGKRGALGLMVMVRLILNGFIFGHFTPLIVLSYAFQALCLECAAGLWRRKEDPGEGKWHEGILGAVLFGFVDIVTTYMNFMAYMTLYRLYYAEWYLSAVIGAGFLYTAAGGYLGWRIGRELRRVALD